ncbi:MAG: nucleotide sugar dehydrogenase [Candidatus Aminicenantes bacterium]|nr:nucleotide sugar dehydrogenase [Candidatus Aminicenantes bacterium]
MIPEKIAVVGAGVVGVPMAASLAVSRLDDPSARPVEVVLIQRNSPTSGWKVAAVNNGDSPLGGIEPGLDPVIRKAAASKALRASFDYAEVRDAEAVLFCVQTDKHGFGPDYGPLLEAVEAAAGALRKKPAGNKPLVIFESTLAPTTMSTIMRERFSAHGLLDGRDIRLANSPNRVMPGFLLERIRTSDKLVGALQPETAAAVAALYRPVVSAGRLLQTNSLTAETVKTFENAARDVRIACAAEMVRLCDRLDVDFHALRMEINRRLAWDDDASVNPAAVPVGGLLVPTIGVGGHCLPKDGILLLWRMIESGRDMSQSLILESRRINDEAPAYAASRTQALWGPPSGKRIALLGTAYRPNSEDTRNSPTLSLAGVLQSRGARVTLHDPHVRPGDQNLERTGLTGAFTRDLDEALAGADGAIVCAAHEFYRKEWPRILRAFSGRPAVFDGCHLFSRSEDPDLPGLGKGENPPSDALSAFGAESFRAMELGLALEIEAYVEFINSAYPEPSNSLVFDDISRLAGTCSTGCRLVAPGQITKVPAFEGAETRLAARGEALSRRREMKVP